MRSRESKIDDDRSISWRQGSSELVGKELEVQRSGVAAQVPRMCSLIVFVDMFLYLLLESFCFKHLLGEVFLQISDKSPGVNGQTMQRERRGKRQEGSRTMDVCVNLYRLPNTYQIKLCCATSRVHDLVHPLGFALSLYIFIDYMPHTAGILSFCPSLSLSF